MADAEGQEPDVVGEPDWSWRFGIGIACLIVLIFWGANAVNKRSDHPWSVAVPQEAMMPAGAPAGAANGPMSGRAPEATGPLAGTNSPAGTPSTNGGPAGGGATLPPGASVPGAPAAGAPAGSAGPSAVSPHPPAR